MSNYFENINQTVIKYAEMETTLKEITINPLYLGKTLVSLFCFIHHFTKQETLCKQL